MSSITGSCFAYELNRFASAPRMQLRRGWSAILGAPAATWRRRRGTPTKQGIRAHDDIGAVTSVVRRFSLRWRWQAWTHYLVERDDSNQSPKVSNGLLHPNAPTLVFSPASSW